MRPDAPEQPVYEPPRIVSYDEAALLRLVGPAIACARWDAGSRGDGGYEDTGWEHEDW
jgi:hypothetical protein